MTEHTYITYVVIDTVQQYLRGKNYKWKELNYDTAKQRSRDTAKQCTVDM